ncbi:MAG: hypothetical protein HQ492_02490 [Woeseiaceae bacterium]|nr:hypothetical protein [Woeseiaceae bacterium]
MKASDLIVNSKYAAALKPLSEEVFEGLRKNVLKENSFLSAALFHISDSGQNVLVDGHHRREISEQEGIGLECWEVTELAGADEDTVVAWIQNNQKCRRNDPTLNDVYELGKRALKSREEGFTHEDFAEEEGISVSQARRAGDLAGVLDQEEPEVRERILADETMTPNAVMTKPKDEVSPLVTFGAIYQLLEKASRLVKKASDDFEDAERSQRIANMIRSLNVEVQEWELACAEQA